MSQLAVVRIEATNLGQVRDFLRQEWAAFDRELPGVDDPMQWEKKRYLLRAVLDGQTVAVADFYVMGGVAHLSEIIVGQSWRHRGIGAQLMAAFEEMALRPAVTSSLCGRPRRRRPFVSTAACTTRWKARWSTIITASPLCSAANS
jgi:GNAT superfamily N-acetyltransferase